jgi:hypothetical protein
MARIVAGTASLRSGERDIPKVTSTAGVDSFSTRGTALRGRRDRVRSAGHNASTLQCRISPVVRIEVPRRLTDDERHSPTAGRLEGVSGAVEPCVS